MKGVLIGHGMVADTHVHAFKDASGITLSGVLGRDPARAAPFAKRHGVSAFGSLDEAIQGSDFAVITTPPDARIDLVDALLAANMPILMEKPIERTHAAATRIVDACERAGVPLGIVFQLRTRAAVTSLKARMAKLGTLRLVELRVPWWRDQSYYDEPGRGTYARDGGGVLITQAIHTLDLMLHLAGPVTEVTAMAATSGFHRMEAEDTVTAGLRFSSGAIGSVFATTAAPPGEAEEILFHGESGSARLASDSLTIAMRDGQVETVGAAAATGGGADPMAFSHGWHQAILEDFVGAVAEGRAPIAPGRDALKVHALIDAMQLSSREGRKVEIPDG